jgi:hypothetical protein
MFSIGASRVFAARELTASDMIESDRIADGELTSESETLASQSTRFPTAVVVHY